MYPNYSVGKNGDNRGLQKTIGPRLAVAGGNKKSESQGGGKGFL